MVGIGSSLILLPLLLLSPLLLQLTSSLLVVPKILLSAMVVKTKEITAFQQKVYKACSAIPKGKVCTYKELAKKIGSPKAVRAVGSALKNNPFAPKVPCHRVVASDRSLGGFHGSTDAGGPLLTKKKRMLEEEGVVFEDPAKSVADSKVAETSLHTFDETDL